MLVRLVDELAHDLGDVRDRRHPVRVERLRQHAPGLRVEQAHLGERVPDALDDPALDLAPRAERVDDAADVVHGRDALDAHLAGLDVDGDLGDVDAEREHAHAGRVRAARALAEDLCVAEQRAGTRRASTERFRPAETIVPSRMSSTRSSTS